MTWNIARGLERDLPRLAAEQVDVAVLCEAPQVAPPASFDTPEISWCGRGDLADRGLVIAGLTTALHPVAARPSEGRWTCAATTSDGLGVVGVWTCPPRGRSYGAELEAAIETYADFLVERPCVLAGDFNVSPGGPEDTRTGVLRRVFDRLADLGYGSAYHHATGSTYGDEPDATYFHQYRRDRPFHIDFVFLPHALLEHVTAVRVGGYDDWIARQPPAGGTPITPP